MHDSDFQNLIKKKCDLLSIVQYAQAVYKKVKPLMKHRNKYLLQYKRYLNNQKPINTTNLLTQSEHYLYCSMQNDRYGYELKTKSQSKDIKTIIQMFNFYFDAISDRCHELIILCNMYSLMYYNNDYISRINIILFTNAYNYILMRYSNVLFELDSFFKYK